MSPLNIGSMAFRPIRAPQFRSYGLGLHFRNCGARGIGDRGADLARRVLAVAERASAHATGPEEQGATRRALSYLHRGGLGALRKRLGFRQTRCPASCATVRHGPPDAYPVLAGCF